MLFTSNYIMRENNEINKNIQDCEFIFLLRANFRRIQYTVSTSLG